VSASSSFSLSRSDAAFSTWTYRIAVNLCLDSRRRRVRLVDSADDQDEETAAK